MARTGITNHGSEDINDDGNVGGRALTMVQIEQLIMAACQYTMRLNMVTVEVHVIMVTKEGSGYAQVNKIGTT